MATKSTTTTITITDNEGKKIPVEPGFYQKLKKLYEAGEWMVIINYKNQPHSIILPDNLA